MASSCYRLGINGLVMFTECFELGCSGMEGYYYLSLPSSWLLLVTVDYLPGACQYRSYMIYGTANSA